MALSFLLPNDPLLRTECDSVSAQEIASERIQTIIKQMYEVAYGEQSDRKLPVMVGLAAPQIGIDARIILVDVKANGRGEVGQLRTYINPVITRRSDREDAWYEGCYSTSRVCGIVSRPTNIDLRAFDEHGIVIEESWSGYTARIFQHEIDHLDGRVFVDHITNDGDLHWVEKHEFPLYRDQQAWRTWPNKCSREKWKRIRCASSAAA